MEKDPQAKPLAPIQDYPRSDIEFGDLKPKSAIKRRDEKRSKCLVYLLAGLVIQGTVLLIFASIFLRVTTPSVEIASAIVTNLKFGNSSDPSFNFTLITEVKIENSNFGDFRFDNTTGSFWCGFVVVGDMKIPTGIVQHRSTERLNVTVDISSLRSPEPKNFSSNISSGLLEINGNVKFSGKISVMNIMKRRRHPEMNCFMNLNFTARNIQGLTCT